MHACSMQHDSLVQHMNLHDDTAFRVHTYIESYPDVPLTYYVHVHERLLIHTSLETFNPDLTSSFQMPS